MADKNDVKKPVEEAVKEAKAEERAQFLVEAVTDDFAEDEIEVVGDTIYMSAGAPERRNKWHKYQRIFEDMLLKNGYIKVKTRGNLGPGYGLQFCYQLRKRLHRLNIKTKIEFDSFTYDKMTKQDAEDSFVLVGMITKISLVAKDSKKKV